MVTLTLLCRCGSVRALSFVSHVDNMKIWRCFENGDVVANTRYVKPHARLFNGRSIRYAVQNNRVDERVCDQKEVVQGVGR